MKVYIVIGIDETDSYYKWIDSVYLNEHKAEERVMVLTEENKDQDLEFFISDYEVNE